MASSGRKRGFPFDDIKDERMWVQQIYEVQLLECFV